MATKKEFDKMIREITHPKKMTVKDALKTNNPLENISNNIGDETKNQKIFNLLYSAILEVNSAGTPIIFDRYNSEEIDIMYQEYNKLGARKFCSHIEQIRNFIKQNLGGAFSEDDFFELCETEKYNKINRELTLQCESICEEMEEKLLSFVKKNIDTLEK